MFQKRSLRSCLSLIHWTGGSSPEWTTEFFVGHFGPVVFLAAPLFGHLIRLDDPENPFLFRFPFYNPRTVPLVVQKIADKLPQMIDTGRWKLKSTLEKIIWITVIKTEKQLEKVKLIYSLSKYFAPIYKLYIEEIIFIILYFYSICYCFLSV